jgi:formylglycine-generating enzyme required for sulfatase activity
MKNHNNVLFRIRESLLNSLSYSLRSAKDTTENSGSFNLNFVSSIKCIQKQIVFVLLFMLLSYSMVFANNITIGANSVALTGKDITNQFTLVQFDLTWENSWRTSSAPNNWDAAWVFVKYRVTVAHGGDGLWHHASLNDAGHTAPSGSTIDIGLLTPATAFNTTTNPGLGAFIYRSADGSAVTNTFNGVQLRWNYGANSVADNAVVDIEVFAIEMVYVPGGAFTVGSGGTEVGSFTNGSWTSGATIALSINSENSLTVANSDGNLWYTATGNSGDRLGPIPADFPKGFNAFYCMKYEIMQQQYVDFLNTLTQTQATNRKYNMTGADYRYAIDGSTVGSYATSNPYVACGYLNWADLAAYLDWSGLRPMTELEFEKSCRGTQTAVANEYAWGSSITQNTGILNSGLFNEISSTVDANCTYDNHSSVQGPMRVGAFATSSSTRVTAGATYYGIMEMSGNLSERTVTIGNATGRAFTGTHGNGLLTPEGNASIDINWPGIGAAGAGTRGGSWNNVDWGGYYFQVSARINAAATFSSRYGMFGGRGVRTAPVIYNFLKTKGN